MPPHHVCIVRRGKPLHLSMVPCGGPGTSPLLHFLPLALSRLVKATLFVVPNWHSLYCRVNHPIDKSNGNLLPLPQLLLQSSKSEHSPVDFPSKLSWKPQPTTATRFRTKALALVYVIHKLATTSEHFLQVEMSKECRESRTAIWDWTILHPLLALQHLYQNGTFSSPGPVWSMVRSHWQRRLPRGGG